MPFTGLPALRKGVRSSGGPFPPGSNPPVTFVFRPGGVAGGNIYTDWNALYAVMSAVEGPKWLEVDSSLAPAIVPAGAWDFSDVDLRGHLGDTSVPMELQFADGATATNLAHVTQVLTLTALGTTPVMTLTIPGQYVLLLREGSVIQASGTAPFFDVAGAATELTIAMEYAGQIQSAGFEVVELSAAGAYVQVIGCQICTLAQDTIRGVAGATVELLADSSSFLDPTQANFAGTVSRSFIDSSLQVAFDLPPLNTGTPGNVAQALNQASYVLQGAGNPNAGAGTPALIGWVFVDTVNGIRYMNQDGTPTGWFVI